MSLEKAITELTSTVQELINVLNNQGAPASKPAAAKPAAAAAKPAAPAKAKTPPADEPEAEEGDESEGEEDISRDNVLKEFLALGKKHGREHLTKILKVFKAENLTGVPDAKLGKVLDLVRQAKAELEG